MFSDGHAGVRPLATSGHAAVRPPATYTAQQGCSQFQWVGISLACWWWPAAALHIGSGRLWSLRIVHLMVGCHACCAVLLFLGRLWLGGPDLTLGPHIACMTCCPSICMTCETWLVACCILKGVSVSPVPLVGGNNVLFLVNWCLRCARSFPLDKLAASSWVSLL